MHSSGPDVLKALGLPNKNVLDRAFTAGAVPADSQMPGFHRSIISGVPVMRTYHYPAEELHGGRPAREIDRDEEQELFDSISSRTKSAGMMGLL